MLKVTDKEFWMHPTLKSNVDSLVYNLKQDWESIILVSGDGLLRVGKSMLASQLGYYMAYTLGTPFDVNNIVFSGPELIEKSIKAPKNSVFVYDESLSEMSSKRVMETVSKNLMEFFSECGMYNHVIILVLPDFFDLNKSVALNRSEFLLNVVRTRNVKKVDGVDVVEWTRGVFEFYNRKNKKFLYLNGAKFKDYSIGNKRHYTFWGNFRNFWVIDKDQYEERKRAFIKRNREAVKEVAPRTKVGKAIYNMCQELTTVQVGKYFEVDSSRISQIKRNYEKQLQILAAQE